MTSTIGQPKYAVQKMAKHHDVSSFDCQNTYLNSFLKDKALAQSQRDISVTFVALDLTASNPAVIGYFTLRADSFYPENRQDGDIIPVVELVALARDRTYRGQGVGDYLLISTLQNVQQAAELVGIAGLHLLPTEEGRRLYNRYQFDEHPLSYRTDLLFLPMNVIRLIVSEAE